MTAYKIQDINRRRIGVVAKSLQDLLHRGCKKLGVDNIEDCRLYLEDGTEVEDQDYFQTLPPQTVFVIVREDESWDGYATLFKNATEKIFNSMSDREELKEQIYELFNESDCEEMYGVMAELVNRLDDNIDAEYREEDEEWFDGLSPYIQTKEDAMKQGARSRIRKYLFNAKEFIDKEGTKKQQKSRLNAVMDYFQEELKKHHYFSEYFARSAVNKHRFCSTRGRFECEGPFDNDGCNRRHQINPYGSKEGRILFSTWNLDHVIEKSRQVLPTLLKAADECPKGYEINWHYFFDLLFTRKNLKLVHIGCHVKGEHVGYECQKKKFYTKKR